MNKLIFSIFFLSLSCSTEQTNYQKSTYYKKNFKKSLNLDWNEMANESADFAYLNSKTKSILVFNSSCRKNEFSPLNIVSNSILNGIENLEILSKVEKVYFQRLGVEQILKGSLEGVERYFKLLTFIKNNCIYDYMLISKNLDFLNKDSETYNEFIRRIEII